MICGIHYFSTELKTKIDVIPRGCFNIRKYLIVFSKFRSSNHQLAIEQGRHSEILMAERICVLCNAGNCVVVEDEYHFLFICDDYKLLRHIYVTNHLPPYDETQNGF